MSQCPREKSAFLFDTEVASVKKMVVVHLNPSVVHKKKIFAGYGYYPLVNVYKKLLKPWPSRNSGFTH